MIADIFSVYIVALWVCNVCIETMSTFNVSLNAMLALSYWSYIGNEYNTQLLATKWVMMLVPAVMKLI